LDNHLRALRAERGWSQQHLAELFELAIEDVFVSPTQG